MWISGAESLRGVDVIVHDPVPEADEAMHEYGLVVDSFE